MALRVRGMKETLAGLEGLSKAAARGVLERVLKKAAKPTMNHARSNAPERTGELKQSIKMEVTRQSAGKAAFARAMAGGASRQEAGQAARAANRAAAGKGASASVKVRAAAPHGVFAEYGTLHHPAQPFMRPALDANADAAVKIVGTEMGIEIEKSAKRAAARAARKAGR